MATKLIIDGNAVYEIDEECLEVQRKKKEFQGRNGREAAPKPESGQEVRKRE